MKKLLSVMLIAIMAIPAATLAQGPIRVEVNGDPVIFEGSQPTIIDGRLFVSAREILTAFGLAVYTYEDQELFVTNSAGNNTGTVTQRFASFTGFGNHIFIFSDAERITINNEAVNLDSPTRIINDNLFIPLENVANALGANIHWDESQNLYRIYLDLQAAADARDYAAAVAREYARQRSLCPPGGITDGLNIPWGYTSLQLETTSILCPTPENIAAAERELFRLINDLRMSIGEEPFIWSYAASQAARAHSQDILDNSVGLHDAVDMSRYGSDGSTPMQRIQRVDPTLAFARGGMNIGDTSFSRMAPLNIFNSWYESEENHLSLTRPPINDFQSAGLGIAVSGNRVFTTMKIVVGGMHGDEICPYNH